MTEPAAGWYSDPAPDAPSGRTRWWDGQQWTQHVRPGPGKRMGRGAQIAMVAGVLAALAGALVAVALPLQDDDGAEVEPTAPRLDSFAQEACFEFADLGLGVIDGLVIEAELRPRLQEIHATAKHSTNTGVREAATGMLAAVTPPTSPETLQLHMELMLAACNPG